MDWNLFKFPKPYFKQKYTNSYWNPGKLIKTKGFLYQEVINKSDEYDLSDTLSLKLGSRMRYVNKYHCFIIFEYLQAVIGWGSSYIWLPSICRR